MIEQTLEKVQDYMGSMRTVRIPDKTLVLGSAAISVYVGMVVGGPKGAVVGSIVGACIGKLAGADKISYLEITISSSGQLWIRMQFLEQRSLQT